MKKLIYLLTLIIPLSAQEAKDDPFHESVGKETKKEVKEEESTVATVVRYVQDAEWRKFQAAHRRAHSKRGEDHSVRESKGGKRKSMHKKQQIKNIVRLVVVGGLAYYIGYHQGEKHFNGGMMKRRMSFDNKK